MAPEFIGAEVEHGTGADLTEDEEGLLRGGERLMGSALAWAEPQSLAHGYAAAIQAGKGFHDGAGAAGGSGGSGSGGSGPGSSGAGGAEGSGGSGSGGSGSGGSGSGGSGSGSVTSSPAPATRPDLSAPTSASVTTLLPRPTLMK